MQNAQFIENKQAKHKSERRALRYTVSFFFFAIRI
jgi:hypothetical protein